MDRSDAAARLARIPGLSRGRRHHPTPTLSTGYRALDRRLPGGGWSLGALTELLPGGAAGQGFGLLLPALAAVTGGGRWAALLDPPWVPYPPALLAAGIDLGHLLWVRTRTPREHLWACEQLLRSAALGVTVAWPGEARPGFAQVRRLQLASAASGQAAFLFRPAADAARPSPAATRLQLEAAAEPGRLRLAVLKCRGMLVRPGDCAVDLAHWLPRTGVDHGPLSASVLPGPLPRITRPAHPPPPA